MSNPNTNNTDENSSLNSILLKREAAASAVRSGPGSTSRPPSASSTGSFQFVTGEKDVSTPATVSGPKGRAAGLKRESISGGGGSTGEKNTNEFMSILVDSKVVSSTKKPGVTTPRSTFYQLCYVSPNMIHNNEICGGIINSQKYDAFCGKPVSVCQSKSHQDKKHKMFQENTIYLIVKSSIKLGSAAEKIINPKQFHLEVKPMYMMLARNLITSTNPKLLGVRNYEKACTIFNDFCEEYQNTILETDETFRVPDSRHDLEATDFEIERKNVAKKEHGSFSSSSKKIVASSDDFNNLMLSMNEQLEIESSSSESSKDSNDTDLSDDSIATKANEVDINPIEMDNEYILKGMKFGIEFEKNPVKQVALLGSFLLKQEATISNLTKAVATLLNKDLISTTQLEDSLIPINLTLQKVSTTSKNTKLALDKHKRKTTDDRFIAKAKRDIARDLGDIFEDKLNLLKEEIEALETSANEDEISLRIELLEQRMAGLEAGSTSGGGIFPSSALISPLIPDEVRTNMANIEFKIALLESRVGAQTLRFGSITLKSLVDAELFINDHVPSFSYGCFFDLVALLDSLRDTTTTEKSFLESEYNAQKTKFVSVDEASTSASFLHVAPLVFCGNSSSTDSKYGSIERSLPHVKSRDHWVSLGGMEGMKRQLEEEILSKVGSILEEIPMTLGDSKGADLAKQYLLASQTCFNKFVNWTETFFQELLGNSQVTEKEAWSLILHCWMAFSLIFVRLEWLVLTYPQDIMKWVQRDKLE